MQFQVELDQYNGPIDLLLHIVRREEIHLADIPVAKIVDQYFSYLEVLVELQIDDVGDFLEMATLLMEWKSKQAIPSNDSQIGGDGEDRQVVEYAEDLVLRLLEYKQIRDAADSLDERSRRWQLRYSRLNSDLPSVRAGTDRQPIERIEVWDLVSAFGRILRDRKPPMTSEVIYDETPIQVHMAKIHQLLLENSRIELTSLFEPSMHKSALVGLFMATLELTRHHGVTTDQSDPGRPLFLVAGSSFEKNPDWNLSCQN